MTDFDGGPAAAYDRATFLFETKDYAGAAQLLQDLVEAEPDKQELRLLLARAYYHSAQLRHAEEQLKIIVDRWPSDAYAHLVLARTLQRAGRADEGKKHLLLAEAMGLSE